MRWLIPVGAILAAAILDGCPDCQSPTPVNCSGTCCPVGLPYACPNVNSGTCYDSKDQAENDCGTSYVTCKEPSDAGG